MPNRRSATSSLNTSSSSAGTATICPRLRGGNGDKPRRRLKAPLQPRGTTFEWQEGDVNVFATRQEDSIMEQVSTVIEPTRAKPLELDELIERYGCGPVQFTGAEDALY